MTTRAKRKSRDPNRPVKHVTVYRHYRTGKLMYAAAYGYASWPFPVRRGR